MEPSTVAVKSPKLDEYVTEKYNQVAYKLVKNKNKLLKKENKLLKHMVQMLKKERYYMNDNDEINEIDKTETETEIETETDKSSPPYQSTIKKLIKMQGLWQTWRGNTVVSAFRLVLNDASKNTFTFYTGDYSCFNCGSSSHKYKLIVDINNVVHFKNEPCQRENCKCVNENITGIYEVIDGRQKITSKYTWYRAKK